MVFAFPRKDFIFRLIVFLLVIASLAAAGCSASAPPAATETAQPAAPTATLPATVTPTPSPTPEPRLLLLAPTGADAALAAAAEKLAGELASGQGLELEVKSTLSAAELTPDVQAVVVLPPDPGLAALAAAAPQTQFFALGIPGLQPGGNLAVIDPASGRPDQEGFLAGYLASVLTPDWRVGVISTADTPQGKSARQGFINGVIFYCGLCRPAYPPFVQYPITYDLPAGYGQAELQAAADSLISQGVATAYIAAGAADPFLLEYLAQAGVNLIGSSPPPASVKERWIATIQPDWLAGLSQAWELWASGQAPTVNSLPLALVDVNEALFSEGRQRVVEQVAQELSAGYIDTGVDPATGEAR